MTSGFLAAEAPPLAGYREPSAREDDGWVADLHVRTQ